MTDQEHAPTVKVFDKDSHEYDLRLCPFCGGLPKFIGSGAPAKAVECKRCRACGPVRTNNLAAAEKWNERPAGT